MNQTNKTPSKMLNLSLEKRSISSEKHLKRSGLNHETRLRQNYIISRDQHYNTLQNKIEEIASRPEFNRFINIKTPVVPDKAKLLAKYCSTQLEDKQKRNNQGRFTNRRKLLFMRRPRPPYNSPFKTRFIKQSNDSNLSSKAIEKFITTGTLKRSRMLQTQSSSQQNSMMLKQMVTRVDDNTHLQKRVSQNPYKSSKQSSVYYVSEVVKYYETQDSVVREHISNSMYFHQLLNKYNNTDDFSRDKPIKLAQKPKYKIVFDLDQTLVHCFEDLSEPHEVEVFVTFPGGCTMIAPLNIRPYAKELLAELSKDFQLMIFTASHEAYANQVINYLDPNGEYIQHRLYRRHCDYIEEGYYVKDMRLLNRDIAKVVLVDNAAYSYCFQVDNGIPILPYYEGSTDFELKALRDYLYRLRQVSDVRKLNSKTFKLDQYNNFNLVEELVQNLYVQK